MAAHRRQVRGVMVQQCLVCAKEIRQQYVMKTPLCSRECRTEFRTKAATCRTCGEQFRATVRADKGAKKFCSKECWLERNPPFETECGFCGKKLVRDAHRKGKGHYCDAGCKAKAVRRELHRTDGGTRPCKVCGVAMAVRKNGRKTKNKTCGRDECLAETSQEGRRKALEQFIQQDELSQIAGPEWAKAVRRAWAAIKKRSKARKERAKGGWKVRCQNALASLRSRPKPAPKVETANRPSTWAEAVSVQRQRLRAKRKRAERSAWERKCESTASNIRKRRRRREARVKANDEETV